MAGGTWVTQNKVRPGLYVNTVSEGKAVGAVGDRGIVAMGLSLSWGESGKIVEIQSNEDTLNLLGYDMTAPQILLVREALKRAKTLLLYRLNKGTKATVTVGGLTVTAKHGGVRGNDLSVVVQANIDEPTLFDVKTLLDGREMDKQTVSDISSLVANDWVTFSGTGALSPSAGAPLVNGADGTVTNQDHMDFLASAELHDFHTIALPFDDSTLKSVYTAFVRRLREDEGKKVQAVLSNYSGADYDGVISVKNGVVLSDGKTLSAAQATAWVAGAEAGAQINESLTFQAYDDAVDVSQRYTNAQIEAALKAGEFVFVPNNGRAIVEQDINSFTSFSPKKGKEFSKNRVIRVLDGINNDFKRIFESFYIGKVDNDADGRNLLRNECNTYMNTLQGINAIQNFDSSTDVLILPGNESDAVYAEVDVQPVDAIEKIYMKVKVK